MQFQRRQLFSILLTALVGLSTQTSTAGTMGEVPASTLDYIATLSAGAVWQDGGKTQTFYLAPEILKTYVAKQSNQALAFGEFFLGLQRPINQTFQGQLGLAVGASSVATFHGDIWDDADPLFNNFTYHYKLQHTHLALKAKVLGEMGFIVSPWVSGSIGVGFNHAYGFHNRPTIFEASPTPDFSSHTKTSFAYTVGAGVQKVLTDHCQIGLGYEFADWGKSSFGRAAEQTLNSGVALNHLYTNGIIFNLTYVA